MPKRVIARDYLGLQLFCGLVFILAAIVVAQSLSGLWGYVIYTLLATTGGIFLLFAFIKD